jgi:hypothetical protein
VNYSTWLRAKTVARAAVTWLVLASTILTVAAAVAAVGVLAKYRVGKPLRWLWRTNISGPIGHWHETGVGRVVDQRIEHLMHNRNDGSSLLDLAESITRAHVELAIVNTRIGEVGASVDQLLSHDAIRDQPGKRYGPILDESEGNQSADD